MILQYLTYNENLEAVKKQYKELAKIHHPDKSTGSKEAFQQLNDEYQFLMDGGVPRLKINMGTQKQSVSSLNEFFAEVFTKEDLEKAMKAARAYIEKLHVSFFMKLMMEFMIQELERNYLLKFKK